MPEFGSTLFASAISKPAGSPRILPRPPSSKPADRNKVPQVSGKQSVVCGVASVNITPDSDGPYSPMLMNHMVEYFCALVNCLLCAFLPHRLHSRVV